MSSSLGELGADLAAVLHRGMEIRNPGALRLADPIAPASAPGRLTIDLPALADNWTRLARRAAPGRCAAVIKADAYGISVSEAAPALWAAGARVFFVAHFNEGIAARRALPDEAQSTCSTASKAAPSRGTMSSIGSRPRSAAKRSLSGGPASRRGAGRPALVRSTSTPA